MAQINLFRSSATDNRGIPIVKAIIVEDSGGGMTLDEVRDFSEFLNDPTKSVAVFEADHDVRWIA